MTAGGRTALVVVVDEAEHVLAPWRRRFLRATVERGIPAHVTVLFPFVPAVELDEGVLGSVRALYATLPAFEARLTSVESFPGYAWLAPEPSGRFRELIERTTTAHPEYPPYGDRGTEPVPHCTVGADDDPTRLAEMVGALRDGLVDELPIRCRVDAVTLLEEGSDGSWTSGDSFALMGRG